MLGLLGRLLGRRLLLLLLGGRRGRRSRSRSFDGGFFVSHDGAGALADTIQSPREVSMKMIAETVVTLDRSVV
jgi:hypothetical protein